LDPYHYYDNPEHRRILRDALKNFRKKILKTVEHVERERELGTVKRKRKQEAGNCKDCERPRQDGVNDNQSVYGFAFPVRPSVIKASKRASPNCQRQSANITQV